MRATMNARRPVALALATSLLPLLHAQEPAPTPPPAAPTTIASPFGDVRALHAPPLETAEVRWTFWATFDEAGGSLGDFAAYLEDVQRRFTGDGVRVAVLMPEAAAREVTARKPRFAVAMLPTEPQEQSWPQFLIADAEGKPLLPTGLDGVVDVLAACTAGRGTETVQAAFDELDTLLANVGDAEVTAEMAAAIVEKLPHSGRARAIPVLEAWWCRGDHAAAKTAIDAGFQALGGETLPLCLFADLVLRGDHTDPSIARRVAVEMGPIAAASGDSPFAQLVHLRALLRSGNDRLAGRLVAKLPKRVAGNARLQQLLAETLMDGSTPATFRDLAEQQLAAVEAAGADGEATEMARHKILHRCGDVAGATALVTKRFPDTDASSLNNLAWYACVRIDTMGRFSPWALTISEEMLRREGERMTPNNKDTVALAHFCGGKVEEAFRLQTDAIRGHGEDRRYAGRLARYEDALARQKEAARTKPVTPPGK